MIKNTNAYVSFIYWVWKTLKPFHILCLKETGYCRLGFKRNQENQLSSSVTQVGKRQKIMVVDKGKKQKVEEESYIDEKLIFSIEKLQEIQDDLDKVNSIFLAVKQ